MAVLIAHPAAGAFFLRREMLYTAMTRAHAGDRGGRHPRGRRARGGDARHVAAPRPARRAAGGLRSAFVTARSSAVLDPCSREPSAAARRHATASAAPSSGGAVTPRARRFTQLGHVGVDVVRARARGRPTRGGGRRGRSGGPRSGRRRSAAAPRRPGRRGTSGSSARGRTAAGGTRRRTPPPCAGRPCRRSTRPVDRLHARAGAAPPVAAGPVSSDRYAQRDGRRRRSRWSRSNRRPASSIPQPPNPCMRSSSRSIPSSAATNPAMKPGKPPSAMPPASSAAGSAAGRSCRRQSGTPRPYSRHASSGGVARPEAE